MACRSTSRLNSLSLNRLRYARIYSVKGTQNGGAYIRLNEIKKVPRSDLLTPYKFMKGFVYGLYIKESQQILDNGTLNICL